MILNEQREILFRGKSHFNYKWIYGFIVHANERIKSNMYEGYYLLKDNLSFDRGLGSTLSHNLTQIYPKTLGQYTGFKDCNGERIFEHDIVKYMGENTTCGNVFYETGLVVMESGIWSVKLFREQVDLYSDLWACFQANDFKPHVEVIGNIFDNFELLEEIKYLEGRT